MSNTNQTLAKHGATRFMCSSVQTRSQNAQATRRWMFKTKCAHARTIYNGIRCRKSNGAMPLMEMSNQTYKEPHLPIKVTAQTGFTPQQRHIANHRVDFSDFNCRICTIFYAKHNLLQAFGSEHFLKTGVYL